MRRVYLIYYCRRAWRSDLARASAAFGLLGVLVMAVSLDQVWLNFQTVGDWGGRGLYLVNALTHTSLAVQGLLLSLALIAAGWISRLVGPAKSLLNFF